MEGWDPLSYLTLFAGSVDGREGFAYGERARSLCRLAMRIFIAFDAVQWMRSLVTTNFISLITFVKDHCDRPGITSLASVTDYLLMVSRKDLNCT